MKTWQITYTIQEGEYEYRDSFACQLEAAELDEMAASAALADHWEMDAEERETLLKDLAADGYAFLPGESRAVKDLDWEAYAPIVVTVRGGVVQAISGIPDGVTVEVHDWDGAEQGEQGEAVPAVAVWDDRC